jgi:2-polyprenyl-6-methoxyphenol hydroxylase-like FAD-dependent oxidoreductase
MSTTTRERAVVLGGSIAGLLAARVLADEYGTVTIVERDRLLVGSHHRGGVPQSRHVHALLPAGRAAAEELLPGLTSQLVEAGAVPGDLLQHARWHVGGGQLPQEPVGLVAVSGSRPLIEATIRRRVLGLPNVSLVDGYDIVGLSSTVDGRRITGARVTSLYGEGSRLLRADLVIDCTGRGSRTPRWLTELCYGPVPEDRVATDLTYASWLFDTPPSVFGDDVVVVTPRHPGRPRGGVMQRIEGGRTLVTINGILGEQPPLDLAGFTEYARTLAAPDTYAAVRASQPIGAAVRFRVPTYVRRRYERLTDAPAGLLVAGDAVCAFNPVYAQGMSVAAMTMLALRDELRDAAEPDPLRFYGALSTLLDAPWAIAVGADLATPGVSGPAMPDSPLTPQYVAALQRGAVADVELAKAFVRVSALVDPPSALLRPEIAERVARVPAPVG